MKERRSLTAAEVEAIIVAHAAGKGGKMISRDLGINERTIASVLHRARQKGDERAARHSQEAINARRFIPPPTPVKRVPVPAWARRAGLASDYTHWTLTVGEEAAASLCRRLKRDATKGFAG